MEELFIVVPRSVTLNDVGGVLRRHWPLEEGRSQPSVELDLNRGAYVAELDPNNAENDPLFFSPGERARLQETVGDFRIFALRYRSPQLAREMARAIAASELADGPMLVDADGTYLTASDFLAKLDEDPPWNWFDREDHPD
jgi:hypothetical protein